MRCMGGAGPPSEWFQPWDRVLDWDQPPAAQCFVGGRLNAAFNCVDRHARGPRAGKPAIVFEGEPGDTRVLTYADLYREVNRAAAALKRLGVESGDRVAIYLGMIPEALVGHAGLRADVPRMPRRR